MSRKKITLDGERKTILVSYLIDRDEADLLDRNKGKFETRNAYCRRAALEKAEDSEKKKEEGR